MPSNKQKAKPNFMELQKLASAHAFDVLKKVPFHLDGLPEEQFKKAMDTILLQLATAWAAGYNKGSE